MKDNKEKQEGWYCCGNRRGPAEMQCPFCCKVQPDSRIPAAAILLKPKRREETE